MRFLEEKGRRRSKKGGEGRSFFLSLSKLQKLLPYLAGLGGEARQERRLDGLGRVLLLHLQGSRAGKRRRRR